MTTAERKIAAYKAKAQEPRKTVVRETVFTKWPQNDRSEQLDIFPDGTTTLNGTPILKSELPAWAKKYVKAS